VRYFSDHLGTCSRFTLHASRSEASRGPAPRARVIFLGTPEFAVPSLLRLLAAPQVEVALVVTQPDRPAGRGRRLTASPVKARALEHGLPVFQPERLRGAAVIERLAAADADLFVIAAYGQILRQPILDLPARGCLNVHPSLLPRHRGPAPIAAAILAGDDETGATIMLTDAGMDTGPILTQRRLALTGRETAASLTPPLASLGADLLVETIPRWLRGEVEPRAQDPALATYSRLFTRADGLIDWSRPAVELSRQIRALNPWPRAYTHAGPARLLLLDAVPLPPEPAEGIPATAPGTVVAGPDVGFVVATGRGALRVLEVQPEGRRPMPGADFLRARRDLVGATLTAEARASARGT
jgi:methionyl-tRNA formyltransferase